MNAIASLCILAAIGVYAYYIIKSLKIVDFKKLFLNLIGVIIGVAIVVGILFFVGGALAASKSYPMCVIAAVIFFIIAIRLVAPIAGVALVLAIVYFIGSWILEIMTANIFTVIAGGAILIYAARWLGYFTYGCAAAIRK